MSGPLQSLANPMSTYNTSMRFMQAETDRRDAERRTRVNKEYERALSSSSESESESECKCKCKCKAEKLTPEEIRERAAIDAWYEKFDRERRARWDAAHRRLRERSTCTIL